MATATEKKSAAKPAKTKAASTRAPKKAAVKASSASKPRVKKADLDAKKIELPVVDASGKEIATREVPASIFGVRPNVSLLHQVVRWQRAKKRAGTHKTQTRAEMTGGGAKPWKQKGTGRARAGSNTSPVWVGGGVAHGPKPRSYEFSLNQKQRKAALCGALSARAVEGSVILLNEFALKIPKTQQADKVLRAIGIKQDTKAVIVVDKTDTVSERSLRNIDKITVLQADGLNVYDLLKTNYVVFTTKGLDQVEARLTK